MAIRLLAILVLASAGLAGCVTSPVGDVDTEGVLGAAGLLAPDAPLWNDPQNAPHPAFNYPTLSSVPDVAGLPEFWKPIAPRALPESITGIEHVADTTSTVERGGGIALFGSLAVVPGYGVPSKVVDISNPEAPTVLGEMPTDAGNHRGAVIIPYPDGRLVTAMSTGYGFDVWDITNPLEPVNVGQVEAPSGGHKIGVVPGTPIIYNANSWGGGGANGLSPIGFGDPQAYTPATAQGVTEIYDLTDPASPVLVQEFQNGYGCHHIYFWNNAAEDKYRAICAGIEFTQIWDTADPLNPVVLVNVPVHHGVAGAPSASVPLVMFSHFAVLSQDGTVLVVGDETGGGSFPPGCDVRADTPAGQVSGPLGNLWFYDVSDETNPQLLGFIGMSTVLPAMESCTAHHGRLVPDPEGRDLLAMSFYGAGVAIIDFTDPMASSVVDQWSDGSNTWETWYYNGYLFTGDLNRGLDVLTFR